VNPGQLRQHRENLERFQAAFIEWDDRKYKASEESAPRWRRVQELEPLASRAMDATGRELIHTMPPHLGGQVVVGLSPYLLAFSTYDGTPHNLDQSLRDSLVQCIAELRQREEEERARRRSPRYWADRAFRALLSPVGYLIKTVLGVDVGRSPIWGPVSRTLSLLFEGVVAIAAGRAAGWW
jgi:hypothetical protein